MGWPHLYVACHAQEIEAERVKTHQGRARISARRVVVLAHDVTAPDSSRAMVAAYLADFASLGTGNVRDDAARTVRLESSAGTHLEKIISGARRDSRPTLMGFGTRLLS